jgi:hypothetical protein
MDAMAARTGAGALNRRAALAVLSEPIHVRWEGASGAAYAFQLDAIGTPFQPRAGVYIFCHFGAQNRLVADHIGQAEDLAARIGRDLAERPRWQPISDAGATHVCTLHVPGTAADRVRIETDLRRAIRSR